MIREIILKLNFVLQVHEETLCNPNGLSTVHLELMNNTALSKYSYIICSHMTVINNSLFESVRLF